MLLFSLCSIHLEFGNFYVSLIMAIHVFVQFHRNLLSWLTAILDTLKMFCVGYYLCLCVVLCALLHFVCLSVCVCIYLSFANMWYMVFVCVYM